MACRIASHVVWSEKSVRMTSASVAEGSGFTGSPGEDGDQHSEAPAARYLRWALAREKLTAPRRIRRAWKTLGTSDCHRGRVKVIASVSACAMMPATNAIGNSADEPVAS